MTSEIEIQTMEMLKENEKIKQQDLIKQ